MKRERTDDDAVSAAASPRKTKRSRVSGDPGFGRGSSRSGGWSESIVDDNSVAVLRKGKWAPEEDQELVRAVEQHGTKSWSRIGDELQTRTGKQCRDRWCNHLRPDKSPRNETPGRRRIGKWSADEDALLVAGMDKFGPKDWPRIAQMVEGRNSKQCRDRWANHLDPRVKTTPWTQDEDRDLLSLHEQYGNHWSRIARQLKGRTGNSVKNRYHSIAARPRRRYEKKQNYTTRRAPPPVPKTVPIEQPMARPHDFLQQLAEAVTMHATAIATLGPPPAPPLVVSAAARKMYNASFV